MSLLADLGSGAVAGLLSGVGTLAKDIREAITGDIPADKKAEIELKVMEIEAKTSELQTKINEAEAASEHWFVAGWRPFIGWICGVALLYNYVLMPFLVWFVLCFNVGAPAMPTLDTSELMTLLGGMLGLSYFRSQDKKLKPSAEGAE